MRRLIGVTSMRSGALSDVSMALPRANAACERAGWLRAAAHRTRGRSRRPPRWPRDARSEARARCGRSRVVLVIGRRAPSVAPATVRQAGAHSARREPAFLRSTCCRRSEAPAAAASLRAAAKPVRRRLPTGGSSSGTSFGPGGGGGGENVITAADFENAMYAGTPSCGDGCPAMPAGTLGACGTSI